MVNLKHPSLHQPSSYHNFVDHTIVKELERCMRLLKWEFTQLDSSQRGLRPLDDRHLHLKPQNKNGGPVVLVQVSSY